MKNKEFVFDGEVFTCRIIKDNQDEDLIIGSLQFLDKLQPNGFEDPMEGFANKKAEEIYNEIFFFVEDTALTLPDEALIRVLKEDNPEWF